MRLGRLIVLFFLMSCMSAMAFPKYIVMGIKKSDLDAETRTLLKSKIKEVMHPNPDFFNANPVSYVSTGTLKNNPSVEVVYVVFYTKHLAGKWLGKEAVRRMTDAQFQSWWDIHKDTAKAKYTAMIAAVNKPSFTIAWGDDWLQILDDFGVIPEALG